MCIEELISVICCVGADIKCMSQCLLPHTKLLNLLPNIRFNHIGRKIEFPYFEQLHSIIMLIVYFIKLYDEPKGIDSYNCSVNYQFKFSLSSHRRPVISYFSHVLLILTNFQQQNISNLKHDQTHLILHSYPVFYASGVRRCLFLFSFGHGTVQCSQCSLFHIVRTM